MIGLLSIPTWIIHISSVIEWGLAMLLFLVVGRKLNNVWLRRMPVAMVPYMLSGLCAIAYHMSEDEWEWLNSAQSYLTLTGSCCFALWAFLLLRSLTEAKSKAKLSSSTIQARKGGRRG
jgi:hypothetical protein